MIEVKKNIFLPNDGRLAAAVVVVQTNFLYLKMLTDDYKCSL